MNEQIQYKAINKGFSKLYDHYETLNKESIIDQYMRQKVYGHIERFLKPNASILELNSGSGIDAFYFAKKGHEVTGTDITDGSKFYFEKKILEYNLRNVTFKNCSFTNLEVLGSNHFDYVFSNFGGLNCTDSLDKVVQSLNRILKKDTIVTLVIMGKFYPWDWIYLLKGRIKRAFIRLRKNEVYANIGGEAVKVFYHTPKKVKNEMRPHFDLIASENLGVFFPSVNHRSLTKHTKLINKLISFDLKIAKSKILPIGIGDYYILTFKKR
jgi:ubiquinone/menaquinone biosynthesis C-methylase UbiE